MRKLEKKSEELVTKRQGGREKKRKIKINKIQRP